ncbi:MAG: PDZ domain-containing protein [Planctomycetota bacterium]
MKRAATGYRRIGVVWVALALVLAVGPSLPGASGAEPPPETLLLGDPDVSADALVFAYAGDLWLAPREGGTARRLTSAPGREHNPRFSPDGRTIAYTAEQDGQADVYVLPIEGGRPRRLTWHPGGDHVLGWTPDGAEVLFASRRHGWPPDPGLYAVRADGSPLPRRFPVPGVGHADLDPDGRRLAYTDLRDAFRSWKRYRGGRTPDVKVLDLATNEVAAVPHVNASDTMPVWCAGNVWFLSDRDGRMNLWRHEPGSDRVTQVTRATRDDFDLASLAAGPDALVFAQGGALHLVDPATQKVTRVRVHVPHDDLARRARWQTVSQHTRSGDVAPNGKRAVLEMRGEIVTLPREHGAPRNLTRSTGAHERGPAWSPDGKQIAWFSDASGEMRLVLAPADGDGERTEIELEGAGFYVDIRWSPKGDRILYGDKGNALWLLDLSSREIRLVARSQGSLGMWQPTAAWSPDGAWIAHEVADPATAFTDVALYEVATGTSTMLTDGFADAHEPCWSPDGAWLWFRASVDAGPRAFGLDMSASTVREHEDSLYVAVLAKDGKHPFGPRSDEGGPAKARGKGNDKDKSDDQDDDGNDKDDDDKDDDKGDDDKGNARKDKATRVDLEDIGQRIVAAPHGGGTYRNLVAVADGLLFLSRIERGRTDLMKLDLDERKAKTLEEKVDGFVASPDRKTLLLRQGSRWSLSGPDAKKQDRLDLDGVRVEVDPALEWPQTLREVWRLQRDFFYDPALHGVDWDAAWTRWSSLLPHVRTRDDLNDLIADMIGELCCGHEYVGGGETEKAPDGPAIGLLGCDLEAIGPRYRITRILEGQNWNPDLRAPLTEPGVDVREGDILLRVDGRDVTTTESLYEAFAETANRPVQIEVAGTDAPDEVRTSLVVPIADETALRQRSWVEANRAYVEKASGGRLAYVYMPNTGGAGLAAFDRDWYSQLDKQGLVIDLRYNGGGKVADYVIDVLSRKVMSWWMNREAWPSRSPFGTMVGPKVMLINAYAGSGGDWLPWTFQRRGLGPLVGTRTWGGLVGISGYPPLMDGGGVTAASFGVMDENGQWAVENVGVAPDVEVAPTPKDVVAGRDPQLEKAVALALEALERDGPPPPPPAYTPPTAR